MDSFTLTISHLQPPIFYLATVAAGSNLRPPFSILRSHIWGGRLGARIYNLHSPSISYLHILARVAAQRSAIHNLNLRSLVLSGEPDRRDLLARLGRVRVRDPLGSPVLIYYLYPNDLLFLRRDVTLTAGWKYLARARAGQEKNATTLDRLRS